MCFSNSASKSEIIQFALFTAVENCDLVEAKHQPPEILDPQRHPNRGIGQKQQRNPHPKNRRPVQKPIKINPDILKHNAARQAGQNDPQNGRGDQQIPESVV